MKDFSTVSILNCLEQQQLKQQQNEEKKLANRKIEHEGKEEEEEEAICCHIFGILINKLYDRKMWMIEFC